MLFQIIWFIVGIIIGGFIGMGIATILHTNRTMPTICSECGFKVSDKNTRQCPKCGNPLK